LQARCRAYTHVGARNPTPPLDEVQVSGLSGGRSAGRWIDWAWERQDGCTGGRAAGSVGTWELGLAPAPHGDQRGLDFMICSKRVLWLITCRAVRHCIPEWQTAPLTTLRFGQICITAHVIDRQIASSNNFTSTTPTRPIACAIHVKHALILIGT